MTGDEFKKRRVAIGYNTRPALAKDIGVEQVTVKSWETDQRPVPKYAKNFILREEKRLGIV